MIGVRSFGNVTASFHAVNNGRSARAGFYSTLVSVSSVDILPNFETKSKIKEKKKKRSCRSLAIAKVAAAAERKRALIEIIRKSSRLFSVSGCLSSQKKKLILPLTSQ